MSACMERTLVAPSRLSWHQDRHHSRAYYWRVPRLAIHLCFPAYPDTLHTSFTVQIIDFSKQFLHEASVHIFTRDDPGSPICKTSRSRYILDKPLVLGNEALCLGARFC